MVAESDIITGEPSPMLSENVLKGNWQEPKYLCYSSIGELLIEKLKSAGNAPGQVDVITGIEDTYADMLDRTIKCALWMKKQGIKKGDVISLSTHNHLDTFVPMVAATCIGAVFNPWDYDMNLPLARHFINLTQPKMLFVNEKAVKIAIEALKAEQLECKLVIFGEYPNVTSFSDVLKGHSKEEVEGFQCEKLSNLNELGAILHSSGTTGLPKGVELSHYSVLYHLSLSDCWNLTNEIPLWFSSIYWISGVLLTFRSILYGTKRVVAPDFDEKESCEIIKKFNVTWVFTSTSMTNRLARSGYLKQYDLPSLKTLMTGGALLKREAQAEIQKHIPSVIVLQGYGLTELGGAGCFQVPGTTCGSCGVVSDNVFLKIVDVETGRALGPNERGEILLKAGTMMRGYHRNPEATKAAFDEEGWLRSGDLAYYNEKKEVFIIDRLKELIKYRGRHVSPGVIENVLYTHPAVLEAAVVGIPHPTDDEHPIALVKVAPEAKVTEQELIDFVSQNVMDHEKLRAGIKFIKKFPVTASGKISRKDVKALVKMLTSQ